MDNKGRFNSFIEQIPTDILTATETNFSDSIVVFRPSAFIVGVETYLEDYHFCLPVIAPPPIKIDNREYSYGRGKLIVCTPDSRIACEKEAVTRQYIAMNINKQYFNGLIREVRGQEGLPLKRDSRPYSRKLVSLISYLEEEIQLYGNFCPIMRESIETQLCIQLLRDIGAMPDTPVRPLDDSYTKLAMEYINAYYYMNIKTEDICRHIHISPYHFMRMFKEKTGMTVHEYIQEVRICKAEEMLKKGTFSVEEVSRLCGFANISHFSSKFKQFRGVPPSKYRF